SIPVAAGRITGPRVGNVESDRIANVKVDLEWMVRTHPTRDEKRTFGQQIRRHPSSAGEASIWARSATPFRVQVLCAEHTSSCPRVSNQRRREAMAGGQHVK